jgi:glycosyltransferase involved in cell wall biosynthesis
MTARLGCVLAVRDRPVQVLERTFQTYTYQNVQAIDTVLLDYGSEATAADAYRALCDRYSWRFVRVPFATRCWCLSDAYNRAVASLGSDVAIVFKSDVDVLLGEGVLDIAAKLGREQLCIFSCLTTVQHTRYPASLSRHDDLAQLLRSHAPLVPMEGEGIHAFPRKWFEQIGGYDRAFTSWGFEDSDLRARAKHTIGVMYDKSRLLIHQWHPRSVSVHVDRNREYYRRINRTPQVIRNGGNMCPGETERSVEKRKACPAVPKIAILSFLFNWPSTGGGIVHTIELAQFLARAGYHVRHFYAHYPPWQLGRVQCPPIPSEPLDFTDSTWSLPIIKRSYREAVGAFAPDYVLITDSWNMKPHLADAMCGYRTILRFAALEGLCPLNNLRLLFGRQGRFSQCQQNQLASPGECLTCVRHRGCQSGGLHQVERELAGVGTVGYDEMLRRVLRDAYAVLVLNPTVEEVVRPYASRVQVVPWGMDSERFPWSADTNNEPGTKNPLTILQAGVIDEYMKGFPILHHACQLLWQRRQDFELVATADPPSQADAWTRYVGWKSQDELPALYRAADIVVVPTIAQEGLSRTSVEAMAAGRPVVASNIGGLPYTVADGVTGLLYQPGNSTDLAAKLHMLLDNAQLRRQMGLAGRRRFEQDFTWDKVIDRYYRPLFSGNKERAV